MSDIQEKLALLQKEWKTLIFNHPDFYQDNIRASLVLNGLKITDENNNIALIMPSVLPEFIKWIKENF